MAKKVTQFKPINIETTWKRVGGNVVVSMWRGDTGGKISVARGEMNKTTAVSEYDYTDELWEEIRARYEPYMTGLVTTSYQTSIFIAKHPDGEIENILAG